MVCIYQLPLLSLKLNDILFTKTTVDEGIRRNILERRHRARMTVILRELNYLTLIYILFKSNNLFNLHKDDF